jgi:metal-responsive CopG/Arc/MetJ family transcriptional regulator
MDKELKDQRVVLMMTPTELEAVDEWAWERRIRSRGEAIRQLCAMALKEKPRGKG